MLRLVSWNVLADSYIRTSFYPGADPAVLAPGARTRAIVRYLADSVAEVACLQEVEPPLIEAIERAGGWTVHVASKRGRPDGCALLARRGVTLDAVHTLVFADGGPDRADSGHIALLATARAGAATFQIATTHLRWDPPETPREQRWAIRQARELAGALGAHGPLDLAIVCGDLNVEPGDEVYELLLAAGLADPMAGALHPTANSNGRAKRIDHVLVGRGVVATPLPIVAIADETPLPSTEMPSDHVPIGVAIET